MTSVPATQEAWRYSSLSLTLRLCPHAALRWCNSQMQHPDNRIVPSSHHDATMRRLSSYYPEADLRRLSSCYREDMPPDAPPLNSYRSSHRKETEVFEVPPSMLLEVEEAPARSFTLSAFWLTYFLTVDAVIVSSIPIMTLNVVDTCQIGSDLLSEVAQQQFQALYGTTCHVEHCI